MPGIPTEYLKKSGQYFDSTCKGHTIYLIWSEKKKHIGIDHSFGFDVFLSHVIEWPFLKTYRLESICSFESTIKML